MSGVKGKSGGKRLGSGRKKLKEEYEVKYQLQKLLPKSFEVLEADLDGKKPEGVDTAKYTFNKFVGDKRVTELENSDKGPLEIIMRAEPIPSKHE